MSIKSLLFNFWLVMSLGLTSCAFKRPQPDFKTFQDLENINSSRVEENSDNQLEFPVTPGGTANSSENPTSKRPGITLVLGGAGVSSFATVGLLKRLKNEGVKVDLIVASGWPALFSVAYGFFKSTHDLEWFAMRLDETDFKKICNLKKKEELGTFSSLVESFLKKSDLKESRIPIVIVANNSEKEPMGPSDSGDWKAPLLKTMALPGMYRGFPVLEKKHSSQSFDLDALGVNEAKKRQAAPIFVVQMYDDYLEFFKVPNKKEDQLSLRATFLAALRKSIKEETSQADKAYQVALKASPFDFSKKRAAILSGSAVGAQIIKSLLN